MQPQFSQTGCEDSDPRKPRENPEVIEIESDSSADSSEIDDGRGKKNKKKRVVTKSACANGVDAFFLLPKFPANIILLLSQ